MKVALIGDVHANLPALEAVLADAYQRGVEAIWNIGDIVGYGAFPDEAVQRLQQEDALSIVGNYDIKVFGSLTDAKGFRLKVKKKKTNWENSQIPEKCSQGSPTPKAFGSEASPTTSSYGFAFNWAYDNLSKQSRKYLRSLPKEIQMEEEGKRILLTHGSPTSNEEHITSDTPEERLRELAEMADADVIICGHSHQPFKQKVDDVWFINTGSVGRPDDGDPEEVGSGKSEVGSKRRSNFLPPFAFRLPTSDDARLESVLELAKVCEYEEGHTHQVTRLALLLFDELQPLHCLGAEERFWLHCGALLHDIGWIEGWKGHHKTALRTIQDTTLLPFDNRERLIIGSIARYHRRALPNKKHSHFAALESSEREIVKVLAGILRVADGLDRTHQSLVEDLSCEVKPKKIIVQCSVHCPAEEDRQTALKKGKLLEKVFNRKLVIECQQSGFGDAEFQA